MTAEEFGMKHAFPGDAVNGLDIRTWLIGKVFQGILASGRSEGAASLVEALTSYVYAIL